MTGDRGGLHRTAIRRIVAEAEGNRSQAVPRLRVWFSREFTTEGDEFFSSVLTEFEVPASDVFGEGWRRALEESGGDSELVGGILHEQLDSRENPTHSAVMKRLIVVSVYRAVERVFDEEILKYQDDRQPPI
jgi:hypothetical protein